MTFGGYVDERVLERGSVGSLQSGLSIWRDPNPLTEGANINLDPDRVRAWTTLDPRSPRLRLTLAPSAVALSLSCGIAIADDDTSRQLRQLIDEQVGGIDKLKVPATNAEIPACWQPRKD